MGCSTAKVRGADEKIYRAALYVRLSREDGDKEESNSIRGQKELIRQYIKAHPEIHICKEFADDGFSGTNFDRPAFIQMMEHVKMGVINCILVKDLSRFARNYIEAGRYIEQIFPFLNIRFIAVNDHYDSLCAAGRTDSLLIPFKNLINDAYSRDIAEKIRSQFDVKRKKGAFIGSFAPYGYEKDQDDHSRLVIDERAAQVVRDIFRWKIAGENCRSIAKKLDSIGVFPPSLYKQAAGQPFYTPLATEKEAGWAFSTVLGILKNEVYIGVMVQGKSSTPNFRSKQRAGVPARDWVRVENCHPAIVSKADFALVQKLLQHDTRAASSGVVYPLSGLLFCGSCGRAMVRQTVSSRGKQYVYYLCAGHKTDKTCTPHSVRAEILEAAILAVIQSVIAGNISWQELAERVQKRSQIESDAYHLDFEVESKRHDLEKCERLLTSVYEDLKDGLITPDDFAELKDRFTERRDALRHSLDTLLHKHAASLPAYPVFSPEQILPQELTRQLAAAMLERATVYENGKLELSFSFQKGEV